MRRTWGEDKPYNYLKTKVELLKPLFGVRGCITLGDEGFFKWGGHSFNSTIALYPKGYDFRSDKQTKIKQGVWVVEQVECENPEGTFEGSYEAAAFLFAIMTQRERKVTWQRAKEVYRNSLCPCCRKVITGVNWELESPKICGKCELNSVLCKSCNLPTLKGEAVGGYCGRCLDHYVNACHECSALESSQHVEFHTLGRDARGRNLTFCPKCYPKVSRCCLQCARPAYVPKEERGKAKHYLCREHEGLRPQLLPHGPDETEYTEVPKGYSYSAELELSCVGVPERLIRDEYNIVHDGSVSGDGKEIRMGVLYGDKGIERIRKLCNLINEYDGAADRSCGCHIHIGKDEWKDAEVLKIIKVYKKLQSYFFTLIPPARASRANEYAKPYSSRQTINNILAGDERYRWLNVRSLSRHGTLEVRLLQGTTDSKKIVNWIKLHTKLMDWIVKTPIMSIHKEVSTVKTHKDFFSFLDKVGIEGNVWQERYNIYQTGGE